MNFFKYIPWIFTYFLGVHYLLTYVSINTLLSYYTIPSGDIIGLEDIIFSLGSLNYNLGVPLLFITIIAPLYLEIIYLISYRKKYSTKDIKQKLSEKLKNKYSLKVLTVVIIVLLLLWFIGKEIDLLELKYISIIFIILSVGYYIFYNERKQMIPLIIVVFPIILIKYQSTVIKKYLTECDNGQHPAKLQTIFKYQNEWIDPNEQILFQGYENIITKNIQTHQINKYETKNVTNIQYIPINAKKCHYHCKKQHQH